MIKAGPHFISGHSAPQPRLFISTTNKSVSSGAAANSESQLFTACKGLINPVPLLVVGMGLHRQRGHWASARDVISVGRKPKQS